jgi:ABC-type bacteriocin/lantibiotic exporter with double-glycine peptidase domain
VPSLWETLRYFGRVAGILRPYWKPLTKSALLGVLLSIVAMAAPYSSKVLIDTVYPAQDFRLMHVVVVAVFVLTSAGLVMGAIRTYFAQTIGMEVSVATGLAFFNHVQHLPAPFFDKHQVGEILSRYGDLRSSLGTVTSVFNTLVTTVPVLLVVPPFLLLLSWKLTLLSLAVLPITVGASTFASRFSRRYFRQTAEANADLNAYQIEVLTHVRTLKSMAMEPEVFRRTAELLHRATRTSMLGSRVQTGVGAFNGLMRAAGLVVFTWVAWTMILRGELSLGSYVAFTAYIGYVTGPVGQLASTFVALQQAGVVLVRMFEYLDTPVEQDPVTAFTARAPIAKRIRGAIAFDRVSFHYAPDRPILNDIDVAFPATALTVVIGPSGAGKTSLLRLIPRLIDPVAGAVRIDGRDVAEMPLADVRRQIGVVWQDIALLRGTLLENVTMRATDVTRDAVAAAVEVSGLDEMVAQMPRGLDTPIGEWGATLSGGQRQRIALARALARDTPVLLLDEVTSNLDATSEEQLLARLLARYAGKTIVWVTHRAPIAEKASLVCVLKDGTLTSHGPGARTTITGYPLHTVPPTGSVRATGGLPS